MKSKELSMLLRVYADLLSANGTPCRGLADLASTFDLAPAETVAAALKRAAGDPDAAFWSGRGEAVSMLRALQPVLSAVAKASVTKDVNALVTVLETGPVLSQTRKPIGRTKRSGSSTSAQPGIVDDYLRELEAALGDQVRFPAAYDRLASDGTLAVADLRALAKQFAKVTAKSKADALKKIWARHQSLLSFEAKARATDGRSAA